MRTLPQFFSARANFPISVEGDITLYAKWDVIVFTVSFDTDGGSIVSDQNVNSGNTATEPATPVKAGYTFVGWYAEVNGTEKFDFNTAIQSDITLYARWKKIPAKDEGGCGSSIGGNSVAIASVMLATAAVVAIKGLKKKED